MGQGNSTLTRMMPATGKGSIKLSLLSGKSAQLAGVLALRAVSVAALLWLAHSLASLVWLLVPNPEIASGDMQRAANRAVLAVVSPGRSREVDMDLLLRLPFTHAGGMQAPVSDVGEATLTTGLALVLKGAVPSSDRQASRAIIAEGEEQSVVHVGEILPISVAGVSLADVFMDRVVLDNNGRAEILWMDHRGSSRDQAREAASAVVATPLETHAGAQVSLPASLQGILSATPQLAANGKLGLQLKSIGNGRLFRRLGFRNGDLVVGINGRDLEEGMTPAALAVVLQGSNSARLSILRNGQALELAVDSSLLD